MPLTVTAHDDRHIKFFDNSTGEHFVGCDLLPTVGFFVGCDLLPRVDSFVGCDLLPRVDSFVGCDFRRELILFTIAKVARVARIFVIKQRRRCPMYPVGQQPSALTFLSLQANRCTPWSPISIL